MLLRPATAADVPALAELIDASARELSVGFYSARQIDALVRYVFGVDRQLVADGTYYLIEAPDGPAAAGGWSARRTLYGGDQVKDREDAALDPATDAARIRAFFVHPRWARRGLATLLYDECARAAWEAGFRRFELVATMPGEPLYTALGFATVERMIDRLTGDVEVQIALMRRDIEPPSYSPKPAAS